tara:strand:+ start:784 stop:1215 length:432 start_codon:yes stop_codon:yes gene_type:complete
MYQKFNIQYVISYLGLTPYLFLIIDKYFFLQIKEQFLENFLIYYTLIIFVFIGSINWNLDGKVKNYIAIYGSLPSFISVIIIILNLLEFSTLISIFLLIFFIGSQLILDYFLIYSETNNKKPYYFLRIPLTFFIITVLIFSIF